MVRIFANISDSNECVVLMIDNKLMEFLGQELRKNIKDTQLKENIEHLMERMEQNY